MKNLLLTITFICAQSTLTASSAANPWETLKDPANRELNHLTDIQLDSAKGIPFTETTFEINDYIHQFSELYCLKRAFINYLSTTPDAVTPDNSYLQHVLSETLRLKSPQEMSLLIIEYITNTGSSLELFKHSISQAPSEDSSTQGKSSDNAPPAQIEFFMKFYKFQNDLLNCIKARGFHILQNMDTENNSALDPVAIVKELNAHSTRFAYIHMKKLKALKDGTTSSSPIFAKPDYADFLCLKPELIIPTLRACFPNHKNSRILSDKSDMSSESSEYYAESIEYVDNPFQTREPSPDPFVD